MSVLNKPITIISLIVAAVIILMGVLVRSYFVEMRLGLFVVLFVLVGAVSRIPQRFSGSSIGIELCSIFTVATSISLGIGYGVLVGAGGMLLSQFFVKERPDDVIVSLVGFSIMAFLANFLDFGLLQTGMACVITYDLLTNSIYLLTGHSYVGCLRFSATHILWNYVVFTVGGNYVLSLL